MSHMEVTSKSVGILVLGIIIAVIVLTILGMELMYSIPIGVGMPILIALTIYAMNSNQNR